VKTDTSNISFAAGAQRGGQGGNNAPGAESLGVAIKCQQARKYFLQYSTFTPKRT